METRPSNNRQVTGNIKKPPTKDLTKYALIVDLIKALAWPIIALFALISFWGPLHSAMNRLPQIIDRSKTITIAGLTIDINQNLLLQNQGPSAEVNDVLAVLTPEGIRILMDVNGNIKYLKSSVDVSSKYSEVLKLGLVEEIPVEELSEEYGFGIRPTQLGKDTQTFLYAVISEFVKQLKSPDVTPAK